MLRSVIRTKRFLLLLGVMAFTSMQAPLLANAYITKDADLISKIVGFIKGGPTGTVDVAVLYSPAAPESSSHADAIINAMQEVNSKITLVPHKIAVSNLHTAKEKIIFVTKGLDSYYSNIEPKGSNGTLIISTEESCLTRAHPNHPQH